jgi:hypothetical protein
MTNCLQTVSHDLLTVSNYQIGGNLKSTETYILNITTNGHLKTFSYREKKSSDTLYINLVTQNLSTDTVIYWYDQLPTLRGKMSFKHLGKSFEVKRYILDSRLEEDDASALYFLEDYGFVAIKSIDWGSYSFYDSGQEFNQVIIEGLKLDTTSFFNRIPRGKNWELNTSE